MKTKKSGNIIIVIGKTFGHLNQSSFLKDIYLINDGPPPEINLTNEKNNGDSVSNLIKKNLVSSCHDVSSGGILIALAEMSMMSMLGLKINKPKRFTNLSEYFFAEDQGRYLIEIERDNLEKPALEVRPVFAFAARHKFRLHRTPMPRIATFPFTRPASCRRDFLTKSRNGQT